MKKIIFLILVLCCRIANAQTIEILFPKFFGKTYEFIIFQGSEVVKVKENDRLSQSVIAKIDILVKYAPYTGMYRCSTTATAI